METFISSITVYLLFCFPYFAGVFVEKGIKQDKFSLKILGAIVYFIGCLVAHYLLR